MKLTKEQCLEYYEIGMEYAYACEYEKAINCLLPVAECGDEDATNNLGVCYMNSKRYSEAYKWFKRVKSNTSLFNILKLYEKNLIPFNFDEYLRFCNLLLEEKDPNGYLYLSYLYQDEERGVQDQKRAFLSILNGLGNCYDQTKLRFEYAYLLKNGIGCEQNLNLSYGNYRYVAIRNSSENYFLRISRYYVGIALLKGQGCNQNFYQGQWFLTLSAIDGYKPACEYLAYFFKNFEDNLDLEKGEMWSNLFEDKPLTNKQKRIYAAVFIRALAFRDKYCVN